MGDKRAMTEVLNNLLIEINDSQLNTEVRFAPDRNKVRTDDQKANRFKIWKHARRSQRWAMIADIVGCGPTIFFFDWVPDDWMWRVDEDEFQSLLDQMRLKVNWLRNQESHYLDDNVRQILSTIGRGTLSHHNDFDVIDPKQDVSVVPSVFDGLTSNKHSLGQGDTLPGFPWHKFSCSLDALQLMNICIAEAVDEDEYYGSVKVDSEVIPEVLKHTLSLAKIPWGDRTRAVMQAHRDGIRAELSEKKCITIGATSALEHFETHIIPSLLIEFLVSVRMSCSTCQYVASDEKRSTSSRGLRFRVLKDHGDEFKNLQDVLNFVVYSSCVAS
jgi:hypothetical protein